MTTPTRPQPSAATERVASQVRDAVQRVFSYDFAETDSSVVPGDGFAHLGLVLNVFDPYAWVRGYDGTTRRSGTDTAPIPANRNAFRAEPPGSATDVRGARNVPRPGVPAAPYPGRR